MSSTLTLPQPLLAALSSEPFAPVWFVMPVGVLTFIIVAWHLMSLRDMEMPSSRLRIRLATAFLMLLGTPLLVYGLAYVPPSEGRTFILTWVAIAGTVVLVLMLAWVDVLNNLRIGKLEQHALRRERVLLARRNAPLHLAGHEVTGESQQPHKDSVSSKV